jgi:hypothetical protein
MKMVLELPVISQCSVTRCAYNNDRQCHAKAITVGHGTTPGCDTFFTESQHTTEVTRSAGVGACKVAACRYNRDYECSAASIQVGYREDGVRCLTFARK